jgi:hypothetical protein
MLLSFWFRQKERNQNKGTTRPADVSPKEKGVCQGLRVRLVINEVQRNAAA